MNDFFSRLESFFMNIPFIHSATFKEFLLFFVCVGLSLFIFRVSANKIKERELQFEHKRKLINNWRHGLILFNMIIFAFLWAGEIKAALFSIAAIFAALLVVSKEIILNVWAFVILNFTKSIKIGDVIMVKDRFGELLDYSWRFITLLEIGKSGRFTGNTIHIPTSIILSNCIENHSFQGEYRISFIEIPTPIEKIKEYSDELTKITTETCQQYIEAADIHFSKIEKTQLLDIPSSKILLSILPRDEKSVILSIRYAHPSHLRNKMEQEILKNFYEVISVALKEKEDSLKG